MVFDASIFTILAHHFATSRKGEGKETNCFPFFGPLRGLGCPMVPSEGKKEKGKGKGACLDCIGVRVFRRPVAKKRGSARMQMQHDGSSIHFAQKKGKQNDPRLS